MALDFLLESLVLLLVVFPCLAVHLLKSGADWRTNDFALAGEREVHDWNSCMVTKTVRFDRSNLLGVKFDLNDFVPMTEEGRCLVPCARLGHWLNRYKVCTGASRV